MKTHAWWTEAQINIEGVLEEKKVMALKQNGSRRHVMLPPEQKNLS